MSSSPSVPSRNTISIQFRFATNAALVAFGFNHFRSVAILDIFLRPCLSISWAHAYLTAFSLGAALRVISETSGRKSTTTSPNTFRRPGPRLTNPPKGFQVRSNPNVNESLHRPSQIILYLCYLHVLTLCINLYVTRFSASKHATIVLVDLICSYFMIYSPSIMHFIGKILPILERLAISVLDCLAYVLSVDAPNLDACNLAAPDLPLRDTSARDLQLLLPSPSLTDPPTLTSGCYEIYPGNAALLALSADEVSMLHTALDGLTYSLSHRNRSVGVRQIRPDTRQDTREEQILWDELQQASPEFPRNGIIKTPCFSDFGAALDDSSSPNCLSTPNFVHRESQCMLSSNSDINSLTVSSMAAPPSPPVKSTSSTSRKSGLSNAPHSDTHRFLHPEAIPSSGHGFSRQGVHLRHWLRISGPSGQSVSVDSPIAPRLTPTEPARRRVPTCTPPHFFECLKRNRNYAATTLRTRPAYSATVREPFGQPCGSPFQGPQWTNYRNPAAYTQDSDDEGVIFNAVRQHPRDKDVDLPIQSSATCGEVPQHGQDSRSASLLETEGSPYRVAPTPGSLVERGSSFPNPPACASSLPPASSTSDVQPSPSTETIADSSPWGITTTTRGTRRPTVTKPRVSFGGAVSVELVNGTHGILSLQA